jgi:hypothetical protein
MAAADPKAIVAWAVALLVAGVHLLHGLPLAHSVLLHQGYNWLLDYDSSRYLTGWCTTGVDTLEDLGGKFGARHPIASVMRPPCLGLAALVGSPGVALMILTTACAGASAAVAYLLAARFCTHEVDRLLLTAAFSVSAQAMMLAIAPETYGLALLFIGWHLLLVARAGDRPLAGSLSERVSALLDAGMTITNGALNVLSSAVTSWGRTGFRAWLLAELRTWLWVAALLLAIGAPLAWLFMPGFLTRSAEVPKLLLWSAAINRGEPASLWAVVQTYLMLDLVAPVATFIDLPPPESHPMLDFRPVGFGATGWVAVTMWTAALAGSLVLGWSERAVRRFLLVLVAWLAANILLHWYWQYRGSVFLYGAHSVFALYALVVVGYSLALKHVPTFVLRLGAAVVIGLTAVNNAGAYRHAIDFVLRHGPA